MENKEDALSAVKGILDTKSVTLLVSGLSKLMMIPTKIDQDLVADIHSSHQPCQEVEQFKKLHEDCQDYFKPCKVFGHKKTSGTFPLYLGKIRFNKDILYQYYKNVGSLCRLVKKNKQLFMGAHILK